MVKKAATRKRASTRSPGNTLFEVRPLMDAEPVARFMCFRTPDNDVFIKCDWNPAEKRFNLNCRQVGIDECRGGA
jgi:hypothetical protein